MPAHSTQGSLSIDEQAFAAIQSVGGVQSKAASQIVLIGTAGSSSDDESSHLSSHLSSDSLSRHDDPMVYSREQRARQLREIRATRMKLRATEEVVELDCPLEDLASFLREAFEQLVRREKSHAVTVYNIVINSLTAYYERNGGVGTIQERISEFLTSRFIWTSVKTRDVLEDEMRGMEDIMVEVTAMVLLQLHCILHSPDKEKMDKMEVAKKLRLIYIHNCSTALKAVLEEEITDVFGAALPQLICDLFDEGGVDSVLPVDLEELVEAARRDKSLSVSSTVSPATSSPILISTPEKAWSPAERPSKPSLSSRLEAMLDDFLVEDEPSSEGGRSTQGLPEKRDKREKSQQSQGTKRKAAPSTPGKDERRLRTRRVFVPETPDEKMEGMKTRSSALKEEIKGVVKQTPMDKMKVRKSTRGERLAEMIKTAADSPSLTGGVASGLRSKSIAEEKERRSSMRNGTALFQDVKSTSREEFLSANRSNGERKSRVRLNLSTRLEGTPTRGDEKEERRIRNKRKADGHISTMLLDSDAISKYRKRMKETLAEGNNADDTEVFYGRMSNRVGLFDDRHEKEEAKVVYNRAGRVVYSPSCVFVAHTLLNVHNKSPLLPSKPSTSSAEFKVNRLVKPASKGNRLKLKKLKERLSLASPKKDIKKESSQ